MSRWEYRTLKPPKNRDMMFGVVREYVRRSFCCVLCRKEVLVHEGTVVKHLAMHRKRGEMTTEDGHALRRDLFPLQARQIERRMKGDGTGGSV